jgi:aspartyl-tRNA synthetase
MMSTTFLKRTHLADDLTLEMAGQEVVLNGWVHQIRDLGGVIFALLRDHSGLMQVVFDETINRDVRTAADQLRFEYCIAVKGVVALRPVGQENPHMKTGHLELKVNRIEILNPCEVLPVSVNQDGQERKELRMKYRYLELRRPEIAEKVKMRHKLFIFIRNFLSKKDFLEIETPILAKSTPEGARDFLVPSRMHPGQFYALPQSPQQFKQLLMVSGFPRYFQMARCLRDEDLRADRQLEHTQLDMEMSFVDRDDVFSLVEELYAGIWNEFLGYKVKMPFPRLPYKTAIETYGIDKPDMRFGMKIMNLGEIFAGTELKFLREVIEKKGYILGLRFTKQALSRSDIDAVESYAKEQGALGLAHIVNDGGKIKSPLAKHMSEQESATLLDLLKPGETLFILASETCAGFGIMGQIRLWLADKYELREKSRHELLWVTNFPLVQYSKEEDKLVAEHHPFTMPNMNEWEEFLDRNDGNPNPKDESVFQLGSQAYDLVINGSEMGSGSIRINRPDLQRQIFRLLGLTDKQIDAQFGHILEAFSYGAPPHGGIAMGIDRTLIQLTGDEAITDVIPFPKTLKGVDPMMDSPSPVSEAQLKELYIRLDLP